MGWQLAGNISEILRKAADGGGIEKSDAVTLLHLDPLTKEGYALMQTADRLSRQTFGNKGENHFHIGVNVEPCPMDCRFCSLTKGAGIFTRREEFPYEEILAWAKQA